MQMSNFNVVVSPAAQTDFLSIVDHLNMLPPEETSQILDLLIEEVNTLQTEPKSCPFARDSQLRIRRYRVLAVDNYIFFFLIIGSTVEIRRILYTKRQYERFL